MQNTAADRALGLRGGGSSWDVHEVEACSESAWCPHVQSSRYSQRTEATPTAPHRQTANCRAEEGHVGLHRGIGVAARAAAGVVDGDSGSPAGRRRLDATERPPINTRTGCDLLPAASFGAASGLSH
jgi:hypothetical protein